MITLSLAIYYTKLHNNCLDVMIDDTFYMIIAHPAFVCVLLPTVFSLYGDGSMHITTKTAD